MAPAFLRDLKRRSKSGFRTSSSSNGSEPGSNGNGFHSHIASKSSSTLNSAYGSHSPSLLQTSSSSAELAQQGIPPVPRRPSLNTAANHRYSVSGMSGLGSPLNGKPFQPSPFAPRITSITDGAMVFQKVILVYGTITENAQQPMDGNLTVGRLDDGFPQTYWPVCESHFKALVYLTPGPNRLRFDFSSPKLPNSNTSNPIHTSYLTINMTPPTSSPPIQLVILLGKDSPGTFDSVPARIEKEGNGLDTAIRKFRMAAYLWQAFTAEQMWRNKMGRRCFRFDEEWQTGTASYRDLEAKTMRSEAKIHVIRSKKTVAEIRDLEVAQQNHNGSRTGDLFSYALDDVRDYFKPTPGQKQYVSVLILDAHWDPDAKLIRGHAALGGGSGEIQLAICGSQALQSYPSSIEEVVPAFSDCTRTDTNFVANDCNESGSNWEAANIGIGAHLHETGHLLGCPHQESGVMLRDYVKLNRSFTTREPFSTRTGSKGGLVLHNDECTWHRLDILRFRNHPCFRLPMDPPVNPDDTVQAWPVDNNNVMITAASGVAFVEIFTDGEELCHTWIEYMEASSPVQRTVLLTEPDIRDRLPEDRKKAKVLKLSIKSLGGGQHEIEDFTKLASKSSSMKLPNGQMGFRGRKLGYSQLEGSEPQEVILASAMKQKVLLLQVKVYHGFALDGIEFFYENSTSQLFGKRGGKEGGSDFNLDIRRGEYITGFYLRAGLWIDGLQILTSLGRKSEIFGNPTGGSGHTLMPPRGYTVAGITGSCGQWIDGFSMIITR